MNIEVLTFAGCDDLDATLPWGVLNGLPLLRDDVDVALVSLDGDGPVRMERGTTVIPDRALSERPDVLVVPGGGWLDRTPEGAFAQAQRGDLPRALAERHARGTVLASVCTGALLLGTAGLLRGRPATTNRSAFDDLRAQGAEVVAARVVDDGDVVTAGGVTSGLDLALHLLARLFGTGTAVLAEAALEYERRGTVHLGPRATAPSPVGVGAGAG